MSVDTYEVALARDVLYAALSRCPLECGAEECQLRDQRGRSLNERHRWLLELDDEECLRLAAQHRECIHQHLHPQFARN